MRYLPHTREDMAHMLQVVGVAGLDDLFSMAPEGCRRHEALDLPEPLTERISVFIRHIDHPFLAKTGPDNVPGQIAEACFI